VPTATTIGPNTGADSTCSLVGTNIQFAAAQLEQIYTVDQDYVRRVIAAAWADVRVGALLPEGAETVIMQAKAPDTPAVELLSRLAREHETLGGSSAPHPDPAPARGGSPRLACSVPVLEGAAVAIAIQVWSWTEV
jgi:hypothetical protein